MIAVGLIVLPGCGSDVVGVNTAPKPPLSEAADYSPGKVELADFVNWSDVQEEIDTDSVAGNSRQEYLNFLARARVDLGITPLYTMGSDASKENLGFSVLDLSWEAKLHGRGIVTVARFEDEDDLDGVAVALEECGYDSAAIEGGTLYSISRGRGCRASSRPFGSLDVAEVALVDDGTAVFAERPGAVEDALDAEEEDEKLDDTLDDLSSGLDGTIAGRLTLGQKACPQPPSRAAMPPRSGALGSQPRALGDPFEALLVAVLSGSDPFRGRSVLDYEESEQAEEAFDARVESFERGRSLATRRPLDKLLTLESSQVSGDAIEFGVSAPGNRLFILDMARQADLPWAICAPSPSRG